MALDQDVVSWVVVLAFVSQSVMLCENGGELLQLCENAVESSAGAARGGESEPWSFIGHCGRCEVGYR